MVEVATFDELQLHRPLSGPMVRAISEMGFTKPSAIQAAALPLLVGKSTDFLGLAATGTGKTAAFGIPLLEKIDSSRRVVQALVLCPTRELALQVSGQIDLLGKYKQIRSVPIYGGAGYGEQIKGLRQGAQVVVGTPGRVVDHLEKGTLRLDELEVLILDEADEMISMGFKDDLEAILQQAPRESSNIWLFSATMDRNVRKVADEYLREPAFVQINKTEMLSETVEQLYYITHESNKPDILCKLVEAADDFYGLVFCQTKSLVSDLTQFLKDRSYKVDCLHGDMDQAARERTMQSFRDRKVTLLVCTDVASRGLDVKDVTHVINYSIPRELDNYVHRIGRTARSGKHGTAMSLVTPSHRALIRRIEQMTRSTMVEGKIPTRKEIGARKVAKLRERFEAVGAESIERAGALLLADEAWKTFLADKAPADVTARFLSLMFPEIFVEKQEKEERREAPHRSAPERGALKVGPRAGDRDSRYGDSSSRPHKYTAKPAASGFAVTPRGQGATPAGATSHGPKPVIFPAGAAAAVAAPRQEKFPGYPPRERKGFGDKAKRVDAAPWGKPKARFKTGDSHRSAPAPQPRRFGERKTKSAW